MRLVGRFEGNRTTMQMTTLIGQLAAQAPLADAATNDRMAEWASLINERVNPPVPITPADIHVRMMRLISDEVNDHGGRFPRTEHERLSGLLIDTPVLIGHDRTRLPVARNFAARVVPDGERQWVEVWFYWLRGPGVFHDQLAADIDAGLVKEGSIGFEFRRPQCSICGNDIRTCEHIPGQEYTLATGSVALAHYEYREIVRVMETSLVFRGATPGTHFVRRALFSKRPAPGTEKQILRFAQNDKDAPSRRFAVVLDRQDTDDGMHRYIAARRDSQDPTVCDELAFESPLILRIGEQVSWRNGRWDRTEDACETLNRRQVASFTSGLAPNRTLLRVEPSTHRVCLSARGGRRIRRGGSLARLRLMFGAGGHRVRRTRAKVIV